MVDENVSDVTGQILRELRDEMRTGFQEFLAGSQELQVAIAAVSVGQKRLETEVATIRESQHIVAHDIACIKMRVERIEKHTGLVKV